MCRLTKRTAFFGGACPRHVFANGILIEELETRVSTFTVSSPLPPPLPPFPLFACLFVVIPTRRGSRLLALRIYMSRIVCRARCGCRCAWNYSRVNTPSYRGRSRMHSHTPVRAHRFNKLTYRYFSHLTSATSILIITLI